MKPNCARLRQSLLVLVIAWATLSAGCGVQQGTEAPPEDVTVPRAASSGQPEPEKEERQPAISMVTASGLQVTVRRVGADLFSLETRPGGAGGEATSEQVLRGSSTRVALLPESGEVMVHALAAADAEPLWQGRVSALTAFGRVKQPSLEWSWRAREAEEIWGLGERFDRLNQAGRKVDMWIVDAPGQGGDATYYVTPVLFSTSGYGLFAEDNPEAVFDLNARGDGFHRYRRVGKSAKLYLVLADEVKAMVKERARIQGPFRGVPDWAWGPWISRNSYENQGEAEEAIRGMLEREMPVSVIVQEAWKGPSDKGLFNAFDPDRWPDVPGFFALCAEHDIKNVLWQVPIIHPSSPHYEVGKERGYFVKKPDGSISHREHWLAGFANIDFTHPEAVAWWQDLLRPLLDLGVVGFKADDGEDIKPDDVFHDGRRGWMMHNEYSALYARALTELFDQEGVEGMLWSRSGSLGIEHYPALWAGDQFASWEQMASLIPAGLSSSISGMPFWGHDIGGYIDDPGPELYMRWVQFGAFSPFMQYHGIEPREPWLFGERAERAYKKLAHLRMNLRPTFIALGREAAATGLPIMRPMLMEFPDDARFRGEQTQYMLGSDLLVAPVLEPGVAGRSVLVPEGRWQHLEYPVVFEGPSEMDLPVRFEDAPVLVREGAELAVELGENAALGTWRKGAPRRTLSFTPGRAEIRMLEAPLVGDILRGRADLAFESEGEDGAFFLTWRTASPVTEGREAIDPGRDAGAFIPSPAPGRFIEGVEQDYTVRKQVPGREPRVVFAGSLVWKSPVLLDVEAGGERYTTGGRHTITTRLKNTTDTPVRAVLHGRGTEALALDRASREVALPAGGDIDLDWEAEVQGNGSVGNLRADFGLKAGDQPLTQGSTWLARALRWVVAGPFPTPEKLGYQMNFPPEWSWKPGVQFATATTPTRWWALDTGHTVRNNGINFAEAFGARDDAVAYAMTKLQSETEQPVELRFGSDDTLTVWLNGERIYSVETYRGHAWDQEVVPARLRAGRNTLVVKVAQDTGGWAMHLRLTAPGGGSLRGVSDGFEDHDAYDPTRPLSGPVLPLPRPPAWQVAGPIPFDTAADWPAGRYDRLRSATTWPPPAKGLVWQAVDADPLGIVDLNRAFGKTTFRDAYAAGVLNVEQPTPVRLEIQSDDGMTLWLNGEPLHDEAAWRGFDEATAVVETTLPAGRSRLLARIRQGEGEWKFRVKVWDLSTSPPRLLSGDTVR